MLLVIIIFWMVFSSICIIQYFDVIQNANTSDRILALGVFIIFGPAIIMSNLAEEMLSLILPEGWDDDEYIGKH